MLEMKEEVIQISWPCKLCNNRLIVMFKIIHELVDVQTDVIRTGDSRTRGSNHLYQPVAQKDVYKFSFFPRTIREWNLLCPVIKNSAGPLLYN
jgi:hypothetical protein